MKTFPSQILILLTVIMTNSSFAQDENKIVSKYDFIPGEKVIFYNDFSTENIGDFPLEWLTSGSGEIVTSKSQPGKWFQITKMGYYIPEAKENFTDYFTIEFDFIPINTIKSETAVGIEFFILSGELNNPGHGGQPGQAGLKIRPDFDNVFWSNWSEARGWEGDNGKVSFTFKSTEKYHISFWIQKQRVRMYVNENKVLDVPRGLQADYKHNIFRIETNEESTPIISNFRIAAGFPDMRNKLITEGKLITYGILFDVNSDKIKPESVATIKEIANILKENPAIKVRIAGHTDSDGDDALNLDLSKRRSESVKKALVTTYAIESSRLETEGKGESAPIAPNDSGINKAKNRRVEFIRL